MITAITPEPALPVSANMTDYRYRPAMGERSMLPNSTPTAPKNSGASDDGRFPRHQQAEPAPPRKDSSSMFAAAVIAGALPPTPQTMEELMLRIGTSTIPAESEARLKDLLA